jgi:signal peptidase I
MTTPDGDAAVTAKKRRNLPVWAETILLLVLALLVSAIVKTFFVQMFFVPSGSMRPLFVEDDRILVQKISYWNGDVQRGDVVVFDDPGGRWLGSEGVPALSPAQKVLSEVGLYPTGGHLVKRVIGVAGDVIHCCDDQGRIEVNGVALDEKGYAREDGAACYGPMRSCRWTTTRVPAGTTFVMGDNRNHSADSSFHICDGQGCTPGDEFVPVDLVVGKVFVLMWPFGHFSWLHRPDTFAAVPAPGGGG